MRTDVRRGTQELEHRFSAVVRIAGINPYVAVPAQLARAIGSTAAVRVRVSAAGRRREKRARSRKLQRDVERLRAVGRYAGGWFRTTLVPSRSGPTRLYLDTWMRDSAGATVGDRVQVTMRQDRGSRVLALPPPFRDALERNPDALSAWNALTPSRRREVLSYLNFLKTPEAVERNVDKMIALLAARARSR
jgi:hypothetical protein